MSLKKLLGRVGALLLLCGILAWAQATRVNCGGLAYTDSSGQAWAADTGYSGGSTFSSSGATISDTSDSTLYSSLRQDTSGFSYTFTLPRSVYRVRLLFAEIQGNSTGRLFNVLANGQFVLSNLDVFSRVGGSFKAYERSFDIAVPTGTLNLVFSRVAGDPFVNAIEIIPVANLLAFTSGSVTPLGASCASSTVGSYYLQTGDPASVVSQVWVCSQTGAATYAWQPISHKSGTTLSATCTTGQVFFKTDAAAGQNWYGCVAPNTWAALRGGERLIATNYNFPAQAPGGALTATVPATVTLTPCPFGTSGLNTNYYVYISGGVGTAESVLITGGTCRSGLAGGTIMFTPANNHSGAWTVASATAGIEEAAWALPITGGVVQVPHGTHLLYAPLTIGNGTAVLASTRNNIWLQGAGLSLDSGDLTPAAQSGGTRLLWAGPAGETMLKIAGPVGGVHVSDLYFDASGGGVAGTCIEAAHPFKSVFERLSCFGANSIGIKIYAYNAGGLASYGAGPNLWKSIFLNMAGLNSTGIQVGQATYNAIFNAARDHFEMIEILGVSFNTGYGMQFQYADSCTIKELSVQGFTSGKHVQISNVSGNRNFPNAITFYHPYISTVGFPTYVITGATAGNPTSIHAVGHGYSLAGEYVNITGASGAWYGANGWYQVQTVTGPDDFTIDLNSTGWGAWAGTATGYYSNLGINFLDFHREDGDISVNSTTPSAPFGVKSSDLYGVHHNLARVGIGRPASTTYQIASRPPRSDKDGAWQLASTGGNAYLDITNENAYGFRIKNTRSTGTATLESVGIDTIASFNLGAGWPWNWLRIVGNAVGANVASAATITPTNNIFHITGTATISTINTPAGFTSGTVCAIPDGAWSTNATGNIALASTAVVNKTLCWTLDPGAGKWYPSY